MFVSKKKNSDRILEEYRKKSSVASHSPHHVGLEITVEPLCATTSHKRPKHQNFPSQNLTARTSSKRPPPVSDRYFLGLTVNDF